MRERRGARLHAAPPLRSTGRAVVGELDTEPDDHPVILARPNQGPPARPGTFLTASDFNPKVIEQRKAREVGDE